MNGIKGLRTILVKEFRHIFRDLRTLFLVFAIPIVLTILFGFTISTEIKNTDIAILNNANDNLSLKLMEKITSSGYFILTRTLESDDQIDDSFKQGNIHAVIVIPPDFGSKLIQEGKTEIQIIGDYADINTGTTITNYLNEIIKNFEEEENNSAEQLQPIEVAVKMEYNPEMKSVYMFVPGIISLIMIIVTSLMTSITLSKEKETGTIRMLVITPIRPIYIVIGKIIPYMIISMISTIMVLVLSVVVFKMPINGSITILILMCMVFMFTACAFGVLVSTFSPTQQIAMMTCMMGLFLPTLLLSGFIFPIDNMPWILRALSNIVPTKWFIIIIKDIMIKGSGLLDIWYQSLILIIMTALLIFGSIFNLSKSLK